MVGGETPSTWNCGSTSSKRHCWVVQFNRACLIRSGTQDKAGCWGLKALSTLGLRMCATSCLWSVRTTVTCSVSLLLARHVLSPHVIVLASISNSVPCKYVMRRLTTVRLTEYDSACVSVNDWQPEQRTSAAYGTFNSDPQQWVTWSHLEYELIHHPLFAAFLTEDLHARTEYVGITL